MGEFNIRNGAITTLQEDENGQLVDYTVCKSYGPTPCTTVEDGLRILPVQTVPLTVTEAVQGTMLKLFFVPKDWADGDEWFMDGDHAVYLTTSRSMRGFERRWSSVKPFGDLLLECVTKEQIMNMDTQCAYTIFLRHIENDIMETLQENSVHICCIYNTETNTFIPPTAPEYRVPEGFVEPNTFFRFAGVEGVSLDDEKTLVQEGVDDPVSIAVENGHPVLVTFYCGDRLVSLKYETVDDHNIVNIRTLNNDILQAWVIAKWLGYPGLKNYEQHFGIDASIRVKYELGLRAFENALRSRYHGKFYKISHSIYKSGIEDLLNNKDKYTETDLVDEGMRRLISSVKNTRFRHTIMREFFEDFMQL